MQQLISYFRSFAREEDGAQIIEYALLVAVVSLILIGLFTTLTGGGGAWTTWMNKVTGCLTDGIC